jgi:hypothetical protein
MKRSSSAFSSSVSQFEDHSSCHSCSHSSEEADQENEAFQFMENFYERNYHCHQIMETNDYCDKKVWNVHYDEIQDTVYVFIATLKRSNFGSLVNEVNLNQTKQVKVELEEEFKALELFDEQEVKLTLRLQVFDVDDFTLLSK